MATKLVKHSNYLIRLCPRTYNFKNATCNNGKETSKEN